MKIERVPFRIELRSATRRLMGEGRSKGLHLSEIIHYIMTVGMGKKWGPFGVHTEQEQLRAEIGFTWEERAVLSVPGFTRVPEFERDGILMNPEGWVPATGTLIECKCTWKSMRKVEEASVDWLLQVMSYCFAFPGGPLTRALIVACFVNGNYRFADPNGGAHALGLSCEFTPAELEENWEMVLRNADALRKAKIGEKEETWT